MWAIAEHIPVPQIEPSSTVDLQSQNEFDSQLPRWNSLKLVNQTIQDLGRAVEGTALGTLEDAYTLIIPPLSLANKLPSEGLVEMVRQKAGENQQDYQLDKAYDLYGHLLTLCNNSLLSNERFVYRAVAAAVDFLITTASVTSTEGSETEDNEELLTVAKETLIQKLSSENLKSISISLKDMYKKQKRTKFYDAVLSSENEGRSQENASKSEREAIRQKKVHERRFGYTNLHKLIFTKNNIADKSLKSLEVPDILGWTPLHYAVLYAPDIALNMLAKHPILACRQDLAGRTPLHYAVMNIRPDASDVLRKLLNAVVLKLLNAYGKAEPGSDGLFPLHWAAEVSNIDATKVLLEWPLHREKMSDGDYLGMTPLHFAANKCEAESVEIVTLLLARRPNVSKKDRLERTALHLAVTNINASVVEELLKGDDSSMATKVKDKNGKTALQIAGDLERSLDDQLAKATSDKESAEKKKKKKEESSKKSADGKAPDGRKADDKVVEAAQVTRGDVRRKSEAEANMRHVEDGQTKGEPPQGEASRKVPETVVAEAKTNEEELERKRSKLSEDSEKVKNIIKLLLGKEDLAVDGGKLLLWAARYRLNTTFDVLMKEKVKYNERDATTGQSALHFAAQAGSESMVRELLKKWTSSEVDATDATGATALTLAASSGYSNIVELLLTAGADPKAVDQHQRTALSWAVEKGQVPIAKRLLDSKIMSPNTMDGEPPRSLLARAAENGNLIMAKLLLSKGANLDSSEGNSDHTPIYLAVTNGHEDIVELFLRENPDMKAKPDVNEIDKSSNLSLLSQAVVAGHLDIAKQLLAAGADVKLGCGNYQQTPLCHAARLGKTSFVEPLLTNHPPADTEEVDSDGWTPLMWAVSNNYPETVGSLLQHGARASLSFDRSTSALSLAVDRDSDEMVLAILDNTRGEQSEPHLNNTILWAAKRGYTTIVERLFKEGASVNATSKHESTPLLKAAKRGYGETVKLLLSHDAKVDLSNSKDETPLYWASCNGSEDIVTSLLEKGASPNILTASWSTPLFAAVKEGHDSVADMLLGAEAKVNVKNHAGESPLYWACLNGSIAMVEKLLNMKAEPNIITIDYDTPLLKAIESGNTRIVELMLKADAEFDVPDSSVFSALNLASYLNQVEVVQMLLNLGANIRARDDDGDTPLHQAAYRGNLAIALLLLDRGAETLTKNEKGQLPLHYAAEKGQKQIVVLLLANSVEPDELDKDGRTPLSLASENGQDDVVSLLVEGYKANLESKDNTGRTPLSWAAYKGKDTTVKLLCELKAAIESEDGETRTPLSWAASQGNTAVVNALLTSKAKVESRDKSGRTPLSWAASSGKDDVVKMLLESKAEVVSKDIENHNPLFWATSLGQEEVVKLLLQYDPETQIEARDMDGRTALHHAVEKGDNDVLELILNAEPSLNIRDKSGETPLGLAARKDSEEIVLKLLEADANPNVQDESWRTPLFSAICSDFDEAALMMLERDVDTESHPRFSNTPLQEAMSRYSSEVVDKLLTKGADIRGKDIQGRDAIHFAAVTGFDDYVKLLIGKELDRDDHIPFIYDKQGRHVLHHAACSRNTAVVSYLFGKCRDGAERLKPDHDGWTPLHWAAKLGEELTVQQFLEYGADASLRENLNRWTPLQIAQFHGHDSVVDTLTEHLNGAVSSNEIIPPGPTDYSKFCDGCLCIVSEISRDCDRCIDDSAAYLRRGILLHGLQGVRLLFQV